MKLRPHQQRAFDAMQETPFGQIIIPTGGGKTYVMIADAIKQFQLPRSQTIVVVAPRILLANQLCAEFTEFITEQNSKFGLDIAHVHSGEPHHFSTTNQFELNEWVNNSTKNILIFTTYHSLHKVCNAVDVEVDTIYYDEAHNGTSKNFFEAVARMSFGIAYRRFSFTATPKLGRGASKERGMNNTKVWGNTLCNVKAQELIDTGAILPPKVVPFECKTERNKENAHEVDAQNLMDMLTSFGDNGQKVLVASPSTRVLNNMLSRTFILDFLYENGYDVLHITSKYGAIINGKKVGREEFFDTLTQYGNDNNRKVIIFHYSILSEGINVNGLTHTILLRNLPTIEMAQTIGRVIRVHKDDRDAISNGQLTIGNWQFYKKSSGQITVPTENKYGDKIARRLESIVDYIFKEGLPPIAYAS